MEKLKSTFIKLWSDEDGATVVEYAVMLALIIAIAIATITQVGNQVQEGFSKVQEALVNSVGTGAG